MYRNKLQNFFSDCFKINKNRCLIVSINIKVITVETGEHYLKEFVINLLEFCLNFMVKSFEFLLQNSV
jgi:hypothetical protein